MVCKSVCTDQSIVFSVLKVKSPTGVAEQREAQRRLFVRFLFCRMPIDAFPGAYVP